MLVSALRSRSRHMPRWNITSAAGQPRGADSAPRAVSTNSCSAFRSDSSAWRIAAMSGRVDVLGPCALQCDRPAGGDFEIDCHINAVFGMSLHDPMAIHDLTSEESVPFTVTFWIAVDVGHDGNIGNGPRRRIDSQPTLGGCLG